MKLRSTLLLSSIVASVLLSSCATRFTPAQRAQLSAVAVTQTKADAEAYEEPYGGDVDSRDRATAGAGGGLIALAVTSSIAGTQNNMFKGESAHYFPAVKKNTPGNLPSSLQTKLQNYLKADSFFKSRVRPTAAANVTSEITCIRLIRVGKNEQGKLLLTPEVYTNIYLKDGAGKNLAGRTYIGRSNQMYTIDQYAASAEKTRRGFEDALDSAVLQFNADLAIKTGE